MTIYAELDGQKIAIDDSTGEVTRAVSITVPENTRIYTPQEQEAYAHRKEQEQQEERIRQAKQNRKRANAPLGKFFFANRNESFDDVPPATLARLVYLASFLDYDSAKLMLNKSKPVQKRDLPRLLGLKPRTIKEFLKETTPKYLRVSADGTIRMNQDIFCRGQLRSKQATKIYRNGIRKLYENTDKRLHKHLGYVFLMLPFVNVEFNILVHSDDIDETNLEQVEPLSFAEFAELIGYDVNQLSRLRKIYQELTFNIGGNEQPFIASVVPFTKNGRNEKERIILNPAVVYSGSDYTQVKVFALLFK